jgi:hypothetical protein
MRKRQLVIDEESINAQEEGRSSDEHAGKNAIPPDR